jgi:hypothetical protein
LKELQNIPFAYGNQKDITKMNEMGCQKLEEEFTKFKLDTIEHLELCDNKLKELPP